MKQQCHTHTLRVGDNRAHADHHQQYHRRPPPPQRRRHPADARPAPLGSQNRGHAGYHCAASWADNAARTSLSLRRRRDSSATAPLRREARESFLSLIYIFFTCVFSSSSGVLKTLARLACGVRPQKCSTGKRGTREGGGRSKLRRVIRVTLLTGGVKKDGPICRPEKLVRPVRVFVLCEYASAMRTDSGKAQALTWAWCRVGDFVDAVLVHSSPDHSFITCKLIEKAWALFSYPKILQNFSDFLSHRIFRRMHEVLNIDENKN